jgi:pheromone shutdown protein TraB
MSKAVRTIQLGDRVVLLVGTAHISPESIEEVKSLIAEKRPSRVCIELDAGRWKSMSEGQGWESLDIGKVLKEGKGFLLLANLALSGFQRRMGSGVGVKPGEDMLAAGRTAQELGIPYSFCDREVQLTLKRAWAKSGLWNKSKLIASLADSAFSNEKLTEGEIENLKEQNELGEMMGELAAYLPSVKEVLIDERDRYLAAKIYEAALSTALIPPETTEAQNPESPQPERPTVIAVVGAPNAQQTERPTVIAVVGAGHLDGIEASLGKMAKGELSTDVSELDSLPPPSAWSKSAGWIIPILIVGLIALGFFKSGASASLALLLRWVLFNGSLAALGSALCLAHPLTILVSFVAAPVATLNPFVGVGMFAGLAEAFLRKPKVADFQSLAEDVTSLKGFYRNRITHILLVFFLSSIGGMIGNFIALPVLATRAFGG